VGVKGDGAYEGTEAGRDEDLGGGPHGAVRRDRSPEKHAARRHHAGGGRATQSENRAVGIERVDLGEGGTGEAGDSRRRAGVAAWGKGVNRVVPWMP